MKILLHLGALSVAGMVLTACETAVPSREAQLFEELAADGQAQTVETLPFNSEGLLAGTAHPDLAEGEPGAIAVIEVGRLDKGPHAVYLPFVFRNNTTQPIAQVEWDATAHHEEQLLAIGSSHSVMPEVIHPGEIGFATIFFPEGDDIPHSADFDFLARPGASVAQARAAGDYASAPLTITDTYLSGPELVGRAVNRTGADTRAPYRVQIYCFDGDRLMSEFSGTTDEREGLSEDEDLMFSANFFRQECSSFILGVSGRFSAPS